MTRAKLQNYINHIVFVVDKSSSMQNLADETVKVFDGQIKHLATRSKELNQETRASVYLFNEKVECLLYDMDVMRLPSLKSHYSANGNTALIDGTLKAMDDLKKTPELYGDHAFLIYVLTDGEENRSVASNLHLSQALGALPENWTVGCLVPNQQGVHEAKKFGFPSANIQVWSAKEGGVERAGEAIQAATESYMTGMAKGIRGTKNLFQLDASKLTATQVAGNLLPLTPKDYEFLLVRKDAVIKEFVESWTSKDYVVGSAYYQLVKPEIVQSTKNVCVQDKRNGKVYGGRNGRQIVGLPDHEVKVAPANYADFDIFVQSTSTNRKLPQGSKVIVLK